MVQIVCRCGQPVEVNADESTSKTAHCDACGRKYRRAERSPNEQPANARSTRSFACPNCGRRAQIPQEFVGRKVKCPGCAARFRVAADSSRLIADGERKRSAPVDANSTAATPGERVRPRKTKPRSTKPGNRTTPQTRGNPIASQPRNAAATKRHPKRRWLIGGGVAAAAAAGLAIALVVWNRSSAAPATQSNDESVEANSAPAADRPTKPESKGVNTPAGKVPAAKTPAADPPSPGDRLVQLNRYDAGRVAGLKIADPETALQEQTHLIAEPLSLMAVLKQLAARHHVPIVIDEGALSDEGIPLKLPVRVKLQNVTLEDGLTELLSPLLLTHLVAKETPQAILVTSSVKAASIDFNSNLAGKLQTAKSSPAETAAPAKRKRPVATGVQAINRQARALLKQKKYEEAIVQFSRVIRMNRKHRTAWFDRGVAYLGINQNRKALADLTRAIRLARGNADAYTKRSVALNRLGERARAVADRKIAAKLRLRQARRKKKKTK